HIGCSNVEQVQPTAEYPSPNRKKTGTTEQALFTNHKPELHVRHLPSESTTLATPLIIYSPLSCPSLVGCLFSSHAIGTQRNRGHTTPHHTTTI
uniref:Ovule protein n=1 Tax=Mesocestoides corti TaxID=53468 RepID=A0A5K3FJH2_MESCO